MPTIELKEYPYLLASSRSLREACAAYPLVEATEMDVHLLEEAETQRQKCGCCKHLAHCNSEIDGLYHIPVVSGPCYLQRIQHPDETLLPSMAWESRLCKHSNTAAHVNRIEKANLDRHAADDGFDSFEPNGIVIDKAVRRAREYIKKKQWQTGRGLVLYGGVGVGKTKLLNILLKEILPHASVLRQKVSHLFDERKQRMNDPSIADPFAAARAVEVLGLDDLATENPTPWSAEQMFMLLDDRYEHRLATIMTTNLLLDAPGAEHGKSIKDHYSTWGPRLASRIQQTCELMMMTGKDYRQSAAGRTER